VPSTLGFAVDRVGDAEVRGRGRLFDVEQATINPVVLRAIYVRGGDYSASCTGGGRRWRAAV
jgi:hypothetical protein